MKKIIYSAPILALGTAFASDAGGGNAATVDWSTQATGAQEQLAGVVSALVPMVAAVVAMVAGARLLAKLINRAVGK